MIAPTRSRSLLTSVFAAALSASLVIPTTAEPVSAAPETTEVSEELSSLDSRGLVKGLETIEKIPDKALASQAAFEEWQAAQGIQTYGAAGCALSITGAVVSNVFLAAKVLKIKAAIKAAGGAKKFAEKAIEAYQDAKKAGKSTSAAIKEAARKAASAGGEDALAAVLDLLSVRGVAEDCFGADL